MATEIDQEHQPSSLYNSFEAARTSHEFVVQLVEQATGEKLSNQKKAAIVTILQELPRDATILDFYEAIKAQEAEIIGVPTVKPQALTTLQITLEKIQRMAFVKAFSAHELTYGKGRSNVLTNLPVLLSDEEFVLVKRHRASEDRQSLPTRRLARCIGLSVASIVFLFMSVVMVQAYKVAGNGFGDIPAPLSWIVGATFIPKV